MDAEAGSGTARGGPRLDPASLQQGSAFLQTAGLILVESAASVGASTAVRDQGQVAVGLTNTTHFLRPVSAGRVNVEAVALSQGRTHQLWRVDIRDESGKLVAHGEVRLQNVAGQ